MNLTKDWVMATNDLDGAVFLRAVTDEHIGRLLHAGGRWTVSMYERVSDDDLDLRATAELEHSDSPPFEAADLMLIRMENCISGHVPSRVVSPEEEEGKGPPDFYARLPDRGKE